MAGTAERFRQHADASGSDKGGSCGGCHGHCNRAAAGIAVAAEAASPTPAEAKATTA